jgi:hypothetical protein
MGMGTKSVLMPAAASAFLVSSTETFLMKAASCAFSQMPS